MPAQTSVRSYLGVAKETTKGTAVAPTAFIPVAVSKLKVEDIIDPLYDEGLRGSPVKTYDYIQGRTRSTVEFGGPVFADTIGWSIAGLLGKVTTTTGTPNTQLIKLKNLTTTASDISPTSLTFTDFYAANVRAYAGCQISDFTLSFSADGLLDYDAKATGYLSSVASVPTPTFTALTAVPSWQGTVTIGGTAITNSVEGSITMSRPITPIYGLSNTKDPFNIFVGPLEVKGNLRFVMEADTELTRYLTNTQPAIVVNFQQGAGATATQIRATITDGAYTTAVIDRGKDYVEIVVDITGISNTTDGDTGYSPIQWTLQNTIAAGVYQ
jgi:hypothetical protein